MLPGRKLLQEHPVAYTSVEQINGLSAEFRSDVFPSRRTALLDAAAAGHYRDFGPRRATFAPSCGRRGHQNYLLRSAHARNILIEELDATECDTARSG